MAYHSLEDALEPIDRALDARKLDKALELIEALVQYVRFDVYSLASVFGSSELDERCMRCGALALEKFRRVRRAASANPACCVYVTSELYGSGGHTACLEDLIWAQPDISHHHVLVTHVLGLDNEREVRERFAGQPVEIEFAPRKLKRRLDKLEWLMTRVAELAPAWSFLLNHYQDAVAVSAAQPMLSDKLVFYHHADHQLCLGVHLPHAIHVDPHNLGYENCRNHLQLTNNVYWPMIIRGASAVNQRRPFEQEVLTTCTSGGGWRLEQPSAYRYWELIPELLRRTRGTHIHIGDLGENVASAIRTRLAWLSVPSERFRHIPYAPSIANALVEHNVDLYVASFPLGGGRTSLEVMAAGTPALAHQHCYSRFFGGADMLYPEAFIWRTPSEFFEVIDSLTPDVIELHRRKSLKHFEANHIPELLKDALAATKSGRRPDVAPPPLRAFKENALQHFLTLSYEHRQQIQNRDELVMAQDRRIRQLERGR